MKRFQDLEIPCTETQAREFLVLAEQTISRCERWEINREAMGRSVDRTLFREGLFLYVNRLDEDAKPYAMVAFLFSTTKNSQPDDRLRVSNVVPCQSSQLSFPEYNVVLNDFRTEILTPCLDPLSLECHMRSEDFGITDVFNPECAELLQRFSHLANKSGLHPLDEERWRAFIIAAHQSRTDAYADTLQRVLVEELNWPEDGAWKLAVRYEQEIPLLEDYDDTIGRR